MKYIFHFRIYLHFALLQANCYDVLGESAVQTEAILQTRFDNACACSPCILVLRHLHAFNQSSQSNGSQPGIYASKYSQSVQI